MSVSNIFGFIFSVLSIFTFSFVLWQSLREDYKTESIYKFTLATALAFGLGAWIVGYYAVQMQFWAGFILCAAVGLYVLNKLNLRFFEIIDGLVSAFLFSMAVYYFGILSQDFAKNGHLVLVKLLVLILLLFLFKYFSKNYRRFNWYSSGKIGFSGLLTLALYFFSRTMIGLYEAFTSLEISSFVNLLLSWAALDVIISLVFFTAFTTVLFKRGSAKN